MVLTLKQLNLVYSNVKTVFVPTSRKEFRSKFMIRVEENEDYNGREKKKIEGKEGWFVEKYDLTRLSCFNVKTKFL